METIGWISSKQIISDHWIDFCKLNYFKMRGIVFRTVHKILDCSTKAMWYKTYKCPHCSSYKYICFSCKTRFCSSCSKSLSDNWINKLFSWWPQQLPYFHMIFTIPEDLWSFFKRYQHKWILKVLSQTANQVIFHFYAHKYKCKPWFVCVVHTFWAKLNWNTHIHYLITAGGISLNNDYLRINIKDNFLPFSAFKDAWKQCLLYNLKQWAYKNLDYKSEFLPFLDKYNFLRNQINPKTWESKSWFVHISKKTSSIKMVVSYIWRYLKRPVISQSRILSYDWFNVTYSYKDKHDNVIKQSTVSAIKFIWLLVMHIPEKFFKNIQYWWIFANRCKAKYIHIINNILPYFWRSGIPCVPKSFSERIIDFLWTDPFLCSCWHRFIIFSATYITNFWIFTKHFDSS